MCPKGGERVQSRRRVRPVLRAVGAGEVQGYDAEAIYTQVGDTGSGIAAERGRVMRADPVLAVVGDLAGTCLDSAGRQPFDPKLVVENYRDHLRDLMADRRPAVEKPGPRLTRKAYDIEIAGRLRLRDVALEREEHRGALPLVRLRS
jgi:hypothetical protein